MYERTRDLHDSKPSVPLPLKWVGIENVKLVGQFKPQFEGDPDPVSLACNMSLYSSLNETHRAVHISRFLETLIKKTASTHGSISQFCKDLAESIRSSQKQDYGRVKLSCTHTLKRKSPETHRPTAIQIGLGADVIVSHLKCVYRSSLEYGILTTCPCGIQMSHELARETVSHSQRGLLKLAVASLKEVAHSKLLEVAEKSFQPQYTMLKHPDEFRVIQESFQSAAFCEDLARKALIALKQRFETHRTKSQIQKVAVSIKSFESIHPFSIVAYAEGNQQYY